MIPGTRNNNLRENRNTDKTKSKPEFNQFLAELRAIITGENSKNPVGEIYKHLERGFEGEIHPKHLEEICQHLFAWDKFPLLAIRISVAVNIGKQKTLLKKILEKIREEMARITKFPLDKTPLIVNPFFPGDRKKILEDWVDSNVVKDSDWVRNALVCMMDSEMPYADFLVINYILKKCHFSHKRKQIKSKKLYSNYFKQIGASFAAKKLNLSKFMVLFDFNELFQNENRELKSKEVNLSQQVENQEVEINILQKELQETKSNLSDTQKKFENLEKNIKYKEKELINEKERYEALNSSWGQKNARELAGQIHSVKEYFEHEIREARLSLNREKPNIKMALDRIGQMENYVGKLGEKNG